MLRCRSVARDCVLGGTLAVVMAGGEGNRLGELGRAHAKPALPITGHDFGRDVIPASIDRCRVGRSSEVHFASEPRKTRRLAHRRAAAMTYRLCEERTTARSTSMKRSILAAALSLAALIASAQTPEQATPGSEAMPPMMQQMQQRMQTMRQQMEQIHATKDAEERQRLMREHIANMHAGMQMMGGMMMGPMGPRGDERQCAQSDSQCQMQRMQDQQRMMSQRMNMMQMMMEQMMERMMLQSERAED